MKITSRDEAVRRAKERLKSNTESLVKEIEESLTWPIGDEIRATGRAGDYTPEAVEIVSTMYRNVGYTVEVGHYWIEVRS